MPAPFFIAAGVAAPVILLVSADSGLIADLERTFLAQGARFEAVGGEAAVAAMAAMEGPAILLLDLQVADVANGRLLAAIHDSGLRRRFAIAVVSDRVSEQWMARLREGAIDDIVPRQASATDWITRVSVMERGQQVGSALEDLRGLVGAGAQHDPATGVLNREALLTSLFRESDRVERMGGEMCLVAIGIDDFDHWIRKLGREGCDRVLRTVAQRIGGVMRSYDLLGRAGRAEFLLALPECSMVNAVPMAERLRGEVFEEPFPVKVGAREIRQIRWTATLGIAAGRGRSPLAVMREAEVTMEAARLAGPNTIRRSREVSEDRLGPEELVADSRQTS
jgi:two-component system, cell cycle response regulator